MLNKIEKEIIKKYANRRNIICLNCNKKINKGLSSWCSFKCYSKFIEKYNLKTDKQIKNKVFGLVKELIK